jgi:hypothetical protein
VSDRIQISIEARENASRVFGQVGDAAQQMGQDVNDAADLFQALTTQYGMTADAARDVVAAQGLSTAALDRTGAAAAATTADMRALGTSADTVAPAMRDAATATTEAGTAATSSGASWRSLQNDLLNIGAAAGVAVAGLSLVGQAARDHEIAVRTIGATYGENAEAMVAFADEIQRTTNFSNDAALESANIAATLGRNYGFTFQEIQQVLTISADLAATTGRTLEDATQRVVAAMRGEAESAEMLGLTLNQAAIDHDNVTLSMSNQEAGHFRLNALIEQSSFAMGEAATQADTTYGSLTNLKDSVQDNVVAFGDALGPVGELGAFLADNAMQSVLAGAGLAQLARGLGSLNTVMRQTSVASTALNLALGPAGLVLAAGAAVAGLVLFTDFLETDIPESSQAAQDSIDDLITKIVEAGDTSELGQMVLGLDDVIATNNATIDSFSALREEIIAATDYISYYFGPNGELAATEPVFQNLKAISAELWQSISADGVISVAELDAALASLSEEASALEEVNAGLLAGQNELNAILDMAGEGAAFAKSEALAYTAALLAGTITAAEYETLLQGLIQGYGNTQEAALAATGALEEAGAATLAAGEAAAAAEERYLALGGSMVESLQAGMIALQEFNAEQSAGADAAGDIMASLNALVDPTAALTAEQIALADAVNDVTENFLNQNQAAEDTARGIDITTNAAQEYLDIANELRATERNANQERDTAVDFLLAQVGAYDEVSAAIERTLGLRRELAAASERLPTDVWDAHTEAIEAAVDAQQQAIQAGKDAFASIGGDMAAAAEAEADRIAEGNAVIMERIELYKELEAGIAGPVEAAANAFRIIVTNTDALASSAEQAHEWIDGLVTAFDREDVYGNVIGSWSEIDALLASGQISLHDYNAAWDAHNEIAAAHVSIQENVNALQAEYAPLIANSQTALAAYVENLRTLPEDQQAAALAAMDTATSMQAIELAAYATSGASQEAMNAIIGGAAAADPFLAALLSQMGIIATTDAEGNVSVQVEGDSEVSALQSAIDTLNASTDIIKSILIQVDDSELQELTGRGSAIERLAASETTVVFRATMEVDDSDAVTKIDGATSKLNNEWGGASATAQVLAENGDATAKIDTAGDKLSGWDGSTGTADVNANDNASSTISSVSSALSALNGRTATTYINTVYTTTYQTIGTPAFAPFAGGGVVDGYADGGIVARMAENGPELLHFPMGGVAVAPSPGIYAVARGTYVDPAPATAHKLSGMGGGFTLVNNGTIIGVPDLERQITRTISEGLRRANAIHRSSFA